MKDDYYPDNEPISYEIMEDGILIHQKEDPWLHVKKSMYLSFGKENTGEANRLTVLHKVVNTGSEKFRMALWPVTSVAPDKEYPDGNVSYETFMCKHMIEMESLSPLAEVLPGESLEHREVWELKNKVM